MVRALIIDRDGDGVTQVIEEVDDSRLPDGDVTVDVAYSTLNYKDGMILHGLGNLVRTYPHVGGIDFVGTVAVSDHPRYAPGDRVILTGWRVGEAQWGGYATRARVNGDWLVPLPDALTPRRAMAIGTAGLTAMLAVMALEEHGLTPDAGEVLVTGAAGGVGSVAVAILNRLGYKAAASTGRKEAREYLTDLGATTIVDRAELSEPSNKPLEKERWAGVIDSVGGPTLARALAQLKHHGSAAAVGLASSNKLETTVIPFLLRGVNLLGIDSGTCPFERRGLAWSRIVTDLPIEKLEAMTNEAGLSDLGDLSRAILDGQVRGRTVIDVAR